MVLGANWIYNIFKILKGIMFLQQLQHVILNRMVFHVHDSPESLRLISDLSLFDLSSGASYAFALKFDLVISN